MGFYLHGLSCNWDFVYTGYLTKWDFVYTVYPTQRASVYTGYSTKWDFVYTGYPTKWDFVYTGYPTKWVCGYTGDPTKCDSVYTGYKLTSLVSYAELHDLFLINNKLINKLLAYSCQNQEQSRHQQLHLLKPKYQPRKSLLTRQQ